MENHEQGDTVDKSNPPPEPAAEEATLGSVPDTTPPTCAGPPITAGEFGARSAGAFLAELDEELKAGYEVSADDTAFLTEPTFRAKTTKSEEPITDEASGSRGGYS